MPLYRAFLQTLGAVALLAVALACRGKNHGGASAANATISGTVTYLRVPLVKDAQGVPTGLADATVPANLQSLPARGVFLRIYQQVAQTQPDGSTTSVWVLATSTQTDSSGKYSASVPNNRPTTVELLSTFTGGTAQVVHLIAEPQGINSPTPALDRLQYAMRKAADGTAPASTNMPNSMLQSDSAVNFSVGLNDVWWLTNADFTISSSVAPLVDQAVLETSLPGRTAGLGTGSRVLGIGDSIASFVTIYGTAIPGATLDLHYWPGRSEPKGSYVEYDRSVFPQSYDSSASIYRYFGTLRGDAANDDAWDEGVILPLLARNALYAGNQSLNSAGRSFSVPSNPLLPTSVALADLSPDLARIEGLADAMAANVLKSPYLADTRGTSLAAPVRDIRDLSGLSAAQLTPCSAPALRAFAWKVILKANSLPSPGAAADWANINALAAARFFLAPTGLTNGATDSSAHDLEPLNIYSQIARLKEVKLAAEPVDLATVFTDSALTALGAPFGIAWPRPTTGPYATFALDWGTDPNSARAPLSPMVFSMAKAAQVNGAYPNVSTGEVAYAGFSLSADKRYLLTASFSPALIPGAQVQVDLPMMARTFSFTGTGGSSDVVVIPVNSTAPFFHPVRIRLKSPAAIQPDVTMTLAFTPVP